MRVNIFMILMYFMTGVMNIPCYSGILRSKPVEDNRGRRAPARAAANPPADPPVQAPPAHAVAHPPGALPPTLPIGGQQDPQLHAIAATIHASLSPGEYSVQ